MERAESFRVGTYKFACVSSLKRALQKSGKEKTLELKTHKLYAIPNVANEANRNFLLGLTFFPLNY